ncbi:DedA family protein [Ammoniphilus sp. CFH 90114]|uniref:DedA family protein n=1 Tax=Ammoniphilus sp. CFH 90114 TaxID=2493665 RepID=UPI00100EF4D1|nr:DedA family protein [Ammoniphilus sp. CFH 90114]RXT03715.1 DedA family protein [Ammoniphilus sp. CFH 90114]
MDLDVILHGVEHYGYAALFFFLWLGIVGMPIPDEVIVMSGGFMTSTGIFEPLPAFILTYAGVVSGLTIGYCVGRAIGFPAIQYLMRKKKMGKYIEKAHDLIKRYGAFSLVLSYFLPVVRHVVPYIVGMNKMPFYQYALFSFSTGFVWTLALFITGMYFGQSIEVISRYMTHIGWMAISISGITALVIFLVNKIKKTGEQVE